jgi:uncharacterized protein YggT (Ycf19 family)
MDVIDWILNLACVLLWLNWRSLRPARSTAPSGVTLASALKPLKPGAGRNIPSLTMLLGILFFRSLFYHQLGSSVNWTPALNLGAMVVPFRSDHLPRILLFSFLHFGVWLFGLHTWLLLLSVLNTKTSGPNPVQRLARAHLGSMDRWSAGWKLAAAPLAAFSLWIVLHPAMVRTGLLPAQISAGRIVEQGILLSIATVLLWKHVLLGILVAHLANSYLYLGDATLWQFASDIAGRLLRPLQRLPLRIGRMDFAPLIAISLVIAASEALQFWLPKINQRL